MQPMIAEFFEFMGAVRDWIGCRDEGFLPLCYHAVPKLMNAAGILLVSQTPFADK